MNWLKTRHSPAERRIQAREFNAADGIAQIEKAASLPAFAVDCERMSDRRLRAETVQHRAEDLVVVEAVYESFIERHLIGHGAVDDALVQVGRAQPPDFAGEHDVVTVVHLREVIERARLLGEGQHVLPPVVLDREISLFDVDVRRSVFAHRSELDQVAIRLKFAQGETEH